MSCGSLKNLQGDKCPYIGDIAKRLIFVPEFNKAGVKNEIATVAWVTKAALQAKFDEADVLERFFPISTLENVEDLRADAEFFEFNSGRKNKVKDGTRTFVGFIPYQGPEYLGKLKEWGCNPFGAYIIDKAGNFIYKTDKSTKLLVEPIMIDHNSYSAELVKKTDSEPAMIKITFDFRENQADELLRVIDVDDLDFDGLSNNDVYGLYDAKHAVSGISTTAFTSTINENDYGFEIEGLIAGDFSLYNDTQSAAVVITSVTESAAGVYDFVIPLQVSADSMTLSMTKSGYDDALIEAEKVVIP